MTRLEKLALQMANNWHEQQRLIQEIETGTLNETDQVLTELRLETLSSLMDYQKDQVFAELPQLLTRNNGK